MKAYEECLSATSTHNAPWYAVPADDKRNARLIVSQVILDTLSGLRMTYPKPDARRLKELHEIRTDRLPHGVCLSMEDWRRLAADTLHGFVVRISLGPPIKSET